MAEGMLLLLADISDEFSIIDGGFVFSSKLSPAFRLFPLLIINLSSIVAVVMVVDFFVSALVLTEGTIVCVLSLVWLVTVELVAVDIREPATNAKKR